MSKTLRSLAFSIGTLIGFLVLVALALLVFLDVDAYKPRFEAVASAVLGMEVEVGGRLVVGFFPGLLVTLEDVRVRNHGADVATVKQVRLEIDFLSLLRNEIRIETIALEHPRITIEKDRAGRFNFEKPEVAGGTSPALNLAKVSLSDGTLAYTDIQSGQGFEAGQCRLDVNRLRLSERVRPGLMKYLSLSAELVCSEIRTKRYVASDLRLSIAGNNGVFDLKPVTMSLFGGRGSGSVRADFAGAIPVYLVRYSLSRFPVEELLKALSLQKLMVGPMGLSVDLSMGGKTMDELKRNAQGRISLRGNNLSLDGRDLDREFARFESSQNFNLVDAGAYLFAGPFGLLVTKGYDFGRILQGSGGRSEIRTLVSNWKLDHGVARAQDVAMATKENRVALQGGLDLVNERFDDLTMALIDAQSCAKVRQTIRGTFQKPLVEKPSILKSLTGPVLKLVKKARDIFPGGECEVFYAGSVAPPK